MPYNEAPSRRFAWDSDGSVALRSEATGNDGPSPGDFGAVPWTNASLSERVNGNDEDSDSYFHSKSGGGSGITVHILMAILFPESRDLDGMYVVATSTGTVNNYWMYKSQDTTTGVDGAWVDTEVPRETDVALDHYRNNIKALSFPSVKGIKGNIDSVGTNKATFWHTIHLYGVISAGETPDRIIFLDTEDSDAEFTKVLDFGDTPRGGTSTRTFKIKNNSSSKTINTIEVTAEDIFLNAGGWYTFSENDADYFTSFSVGNLGPGATKLLYMKRVIPDDETIGVQAGRIKASHASVS